MEREFCIEVYIPEKEKLSDTFFGRIIIRMLWRIGIAIAAIIIYLIYMAFN